MKKALTIAIAALLVGTLVPSAGQAAKQGTKKSCPKDAFCLWTKTDYKGKRLVLKKVGSKTNLPPAFDNRVSSAKSRYTGGGLAYLYDEKGAKGEFRCFSNGSKVPDMGHEFTKFDNVGSSVLLPKGQGPLCI